MSEIWTGEQFGLFMFRTSSVGVWNMDTLEFLQVLRGSITSLMQNPTHILTSVNEKTLTQPFPLSMKLMSGIWTGEQVGLSRFLTSSSNFWNMARIWPNFLTFFGTLGSIRFWNDLVLLKEIIHFLYAIRNFFIRIVHNKAQYLKEKNIIRVIVNLLFETIA